MRLIFTGQDPSSFCRVEKRLTRSRCVCDGGSGKLKKTCTKWGFTCPTGTKKFFLGGSVEMVRIGRAKTTEPIKLPFRMVSWVHPSNRVLAGSAYWRHLTNPVEQLCVAATSGYTISGNAACFQITLRAILYYVTYSNNCRFMLLP